MRTIRRKVRVESRLIATDGLPQMGPDHYLSFLPQLHDQLQPELYFEIGTESGASLSFARCESVAVDPEFKLEGGALAGKTTIHLHQTTSDDFFASGALDRIGRPVDLAFLDGMHLFEFLLRDFMHTEQRMRPGGVILMHDCVPMSLIAAERDWDRAKTATWTGDVWKLLPILTLYRPDLEVIAHPLAPSGLIEVRNLAPGDGRLAAAYDEILARYGDMSLEDFGIDAFGALIARLRPGADTQMNAAQPLIAVKSPFQEGRRHSMGERIYSASLAEAFRDLGFSARVDDFLDWADHANPAEFAVVIRGKAAYAPAPGQHAACWMISELIAPEASDELSRYDAAFFASRAFAEAHAAALRPADGVLFQATDRAIFHPGERVHDGPVVFVGNNYRRKDIRPIIARVLAEDLPIDVYGARWERQLGPDRLRATAAPNRELGDIYRQAGVVLNDHREVMRENDLISNRVFDVLACATPLISDRINGLPEGFEEFVRFLEEDRPLADLIAEARGEDETMRNRRRDFAAHVVETYSFHAAARRLLSALGLAEPA